MIGWRSCIRNNLQATQAPFLEAITHRLPQQSNVRHARSENKNNLYPHLALGV